MRAAPALLLLLLLLLAVVCAAAAAAAGAWTRVSAADAPTVSLVFALRQRNRERLHDTLLSVSDPKSPQYGAHWTLDAVAAEFGAADAAIDAARSVLARSGAAAVHVTRSRDFVWASLPVAAASQLLRADVGVYANAKGRRIAFSEAAVRVPDELAEHVDFVAGVRRGLPEEDDVRASRLGLDHEESAAVTADAAMRVLAAKTAPDSGLAPSAPLVTKTRSHNMWATVSVVPRCFDGSFPSPTCASGPQVSQLTSQVQQQYLPTQTATFPISQCAPCGTAYGATVCAQMATTLGGFSAASLVCDIAVNGIQNFLPALVGMQSTFSNGSVSPLDYMRDVQGVALPIYTADWTTPQSLRSLYGIPSSARGQNPHNSQSVVEFLQQYYSPSDMSDFVKAFAVYGSVDDITLLGPNNASNPGGEAMLDIEYIVGLAPNISTTFWSVGTYSPYPDPQGTQQEDFLGWILAVADTRDIPYVHSVSYSDDESVLPRTYTDRLNDEFAKLGLRGVTILVASGDDGISSYLGRNDTSQCARAVPNYPTGSPFVTSVGGTQLLRVSTPLSRENPGVWIGDVMDVMCDARTSGVITSGGGFSNYYAAPAYQQEAVNAYLQQFGRDSLPPSAMFNAAGRGYPDISTSAHNYLVRLNAQWMAIFGTSAATPTMAAMISLINDFRLQNSEPPLGFVNPLLYQLQSEYPEAFRDVVVGNNRCTTNYLDCCEYGFSAAAGWDAVSGVGVPNFMQLLEAIEFSTGSLRATSTVELALAGVALFLDVVLLIAVIVLFIQLNRRRKWAPSSELGVVSDERTRLVASS